jgi:hypothetical protein
MPNVTKYQHHLARHHMSWFANSDGTSNFWSVSDGSLSEKIKLTEIGGQNHLYESDELPKNFVENEVLRRVENDFFAVRKRAVEDRAVRRSSDRQAVRRYVAAQFLRQGYLHSRLVQLEDDLRFIAAEMGVEKLWQTDTLLREGRRKRASSVMAQGLTELDENVKFLKHHVVIFVERPENDLLLPDRGFVQIYDEYGRSRSDGLGSPDLKIIMPIAPNAALKLARPIRKGLFADRTKMTDEGYANFLTNLGFNAKEFIAGTKEVIAAANLNMLPYLDPTAERFSMVMQIYRAGVLDRMVESFHSTMKVDVPFDFVREWFYRDKFVPAINKLFNPTGDRNAETILFKP